MSIVYTVCQYRGGRRDPTTCDDAITNFTASKWLASTGHVGHLFDGLTYLLCAVQEWALQEHPALNVGGYQPTVYAMDSVFLRSRSLFEFFIGTSAKTYCHAYCLFSLSTPLTYDKYTVKDPVTNKSWEDILHVGSIHLKDRDSPVQLAGHDSTLKDLNQMPVDFAKGILDVWADFEAKLQAQGHTTLLRLAQECRTRAIEDSHEVVKHLDERSKAYLGTSTLAPIFQP